MENGWLIAITGAVSTLATLIIKHLTDAKKQDQDHSLRTVSLSDESRYKQNEQAFLMYRDLVDKLQSSVGKLGAEMKQLEIDYIKTREENASLRVEVHHLRNDLQTTKNTLELANQKVQALEAKISGVPLTP